MALSDGILQHWLLAGKDRGVLDFLDYTTGLVMAAMRRVLREMVAAVSVSGLELVESRINGAYVHDLDPSNDLHIITEHAQKRANTQGSTLQPVMIGMLDKLGIECSINPANMGRLLVTSRQLQQYVLHS